MNVVQQHVSWVLLHPINDLEDEKYSFTNLAIESQAPKSLGRLS